MAASLGVFWRVPHSAFLLILFFVRLLPAYSPALPRVDAQSYLHGPFKPQKAHHPAARER